jgi:hypothetical protein
MRMRVLNDSSEIKFEFAKMQNKTDLVVVSC